MSEITGISLSLSPETLDDLAAAVLARVDLEREAPAEAWLGAEEAATYLACRPKRIYDLVAMGRLRHARDGRRLLFRREWLDAVLSGDGGLA